MITYKQGDVILVPFPFSDLSGTKRRPALVLAYIDEWQELISVMLTSSPSGKGEIPIKHWEEAGFPKYTVARPHRIFTIDNSIVIKKFGELHESDLESIIDVIVNLLQKWAD